MKLGASIRKDFPIFSRTINGKRLVYLDNAATTQKPQVVLDALQTYYTQHNANIHRGVHTLAEEATTMYEDSRKKIADFIHAKKQELIFTRGTTDAINIVALALRSNLKKGDEIITTTMEHHSNIVPWQLLRDQGVVVRYAQVTDDGVLDLSHLESLLSNKTKLVAATHISNVTGTINDIKKIGKLAHQHHALFLVDGAQSMLHVPISVKDLDADFFAFSGHKMLGPTGIGGLYGKGELLNELPPVQGGGDMIKTVTLDGATWNDLPWKFEAGTPPIAQAIGLGAAVDYIKKIGVRSIEQHEQQLLKVAYDHLSSLHNLKIFGPTDLTHRCAVIPFRLAGVHSHDVATIVNDDGVAIRSGHHCAQPLVNRLGENDLCRASFALYNDTDDIETLTHALQRVIKIFGDKK